MHARQHRSTGLITADLHNSQHSKLAQAQVAEEVAQSFYVEAERLTAAENAGSTDVMQLQNQGPYYAEKEHLAAQSK